MFEIKNKIWDKNIISTSSLSFFRNGMEKLLAGKGIAEDPMSLRYTPK